VSTFDYARPLATANRLIARFGQDGVVRRITTTGGTSYDPGEETALDYPARFVVTAFDNRTEVDGSRILSTDKKVVMAAGLEIEPREGDLLVCADGSILSVVDADPLKPAETVLLWTVQARSA
jgi:hypothetical protein